VLVRRSSRSLFDHDRLHVLQGADGRGHWPRNRERERLDHEGHPKGDPLSLLRDPHRLPQKIKACPREPIQARKSMGRSLSRLWQLLPVEERHVFVAGAQRTSFYLEHRMLGVSPDVRARISR
jgi:hypothetical protein